MEIHDQQNLYSGTGSSSFPFNSFLGLLTSDDDEEDADTDQDTYIEIALEPPPQIPLSPSPPQLPDQLEERPLNDREEGLQLRVSFSSRVFPFPGQSALCSSDGDQAITSDTQGTPKIRFLAALNRLLRFFPSTSTTRSWELLVGSRGEADHMTTTAGRSGAVGNFLVKLRATTFEMMMAALLKVRQFTSSSPEKMGGRDIHQLKPRKAEMLVVKPFKKLMQNIPRERSKVSGVTNSKGMRLDGGVFSGRNGREKKTRSCPGSVRSSPCKDHCCYELEGRGGSSSGSQNTHVARDNLVRAAIAHCKKSLGGADDFHL